MNLLKIIHLPQKCLENSTPQSVLVFLTIIYISTRIFNVILVSEWRHERRFTCDSYRIKSYGAKKNILAWSRSTTDFNMQVDNKQILPFISSQTMVVSWLNQRVVMMMTAFVTGIRFCLCLQIPILQLQKKAGCYISG